MTGAGSGTPRVVVLVPTFNEKDNIVPLIEDILGLPLDWDPILLIVDDDSPDGTGELARGKAAEDPRVRVMTRTKRKGRGAAGIDGFRKALEFSPDYIVEMDGDFSHPPGAVPALLEACSSCDMTVGSRFVRGGRDAERGPMRRIVTRIVRGFIRRKFRTRIQDPSSGFRCFSRRGLEAVDPEDLLSPGPAIVLEVLQKAIRLNLTIREVPIVFARRRGGRTKLNLPILLETLARTIQLAKGIR